MKLYGELAEWWPLLSPSEEYASEVTRFHELIESALGPGRGRTLLDLGCGSGNNAVHFKARYVVTLSDLSAEMLAHSRRANPECEHIQGDMRTLRLDRRFDVVFVHDAIQYMTTERDLRAALETAHVHCNADGVALFIPDFVRETFSEGTTCGGSSAEDGRAAHFLEWWYDPDPADTSYRVEFAVLVREPDGAVRCVHDRHEFGLFPRDVWLRLLRETGFRATVATDRWKREIFVARPA